MTLLLNFDRAYNSDLLPFFIVIIFGLIFYILSNYIKMVLLALKLPGPKALPFIGNCLMITDRDLLYNKAANAYQTYGSLIRFWICLQPTFMLLDPNDLQTVLSSKKHTDKIFFYKLLHNFLGKGLITSSGEKWNNHRKLIQPSFHLNILEKFIVSFADSSQCLYEKLKNAPNEINITQYINNCILDILNETVLGVPVKKTDASFTDDSPFRQGKVVMSYRVTRPWLLLEFIYQLTDSAATELNQKKSLETFTKKMIKKRQEIRKFDEQNKRVCLLDYLIDISENNPEFTEEDIISEACTFMLAGQDSVGAAVAFCLFLLAQNQNDQNKCINEMDNIFGTDSRPPTMQDLREMKYLEQCIKETLRLYPSVPLIARKLTEDITVGKHNLLCGTDVFIVPYSIHRLPHIYPEPEKFDPNRFSTENCEKRHPYAYLSFSAGPRNCIGNKFAMLEMKTVISKVLRHFKIMPVAGKTVCEPSFRITLRARGGLWIRLQSRNINL